MNLMSILLIKR